jgi:hypothetical protein
MKRREMRGRRIWRRRRFQLAALSAMPALAGVPKLPNSVMM